MFFPNRGGEKDVIVTSSFSQHVRLLIQCATSQFDLGKKTHHLEKHRQKSQSVTAAIFSLSC